MTELPKKDIRLLHLAYQFAELHCSDGDILGKMAQELLVLIDEQHPEIRNLEPDEELS